jgi:hypothetical protein
MTNSFRNPQFPWFRIFLTRFLFCHVTFARRDTFLQAAADFLTDPLFPWIPSLIFWQHYGARLQALRRFLGSPTSITAASPLGIS